jgi:hypothetical protein
VLALVLASVLEECSVRYATMIFAMNTEKDLTWGVEEKRRWKLAWNDCGGISWAVEFYHKNERKPIH